MKSYVIYYEIRKNNSEWTESMEVEAQRLEDAKLMVKSSVKKHLGSHPFHLRNCLDDEAVQVRHRTYIPVDGINEQLEAIHRQEVHRKLFRETYCKSCSERKNKKYTGGRFPCGFHYCHEGKERLFLKDLKEKKEPTIVCD